MEKLELFNKETNTCWEQDVRDMLKSLIDELELPAGSLYLKDNYSKKKGNEDKLISCTVYIWEPSFPPLPNEKPGENKSVLTLKLDVLKTDPNILEVSVNSVQEGDLHKYLPKDAKLMRRTKSDITNNKVKFRIDKSSPDLVEYIRQNTIYCIKGYESKAEMFGCCSQFTQCSNAKKCVHINKLYAKACMYRNNLEQGKIFYGENRNVD